MNHSDTASLAETLAFATAAHGEQKRKYGESGKNVIPYITHPIAVMEIVRERPHRLAMLQAALLHDVVEDTSITLQEIRDRFGDDVANMVADLTDVSKLTDGNRAVRKAIDRTHTAQASADSKTIKCADLLHNGRDIMDHDPNFAITFMKEKRLLLPVLNGADPVLLGRCQQMVEAFFALVGEKP